MKRVVRGLAHTQNEFTRLFRIGRRVHTPFFSFIVSKSERRRTQIVCIVSKKTAKSSVVRNRLRRRVKEWFRTRAGAFREPAQIAIIVKAEARNIPRKQFYEELEKGANTIIR